MDYADATGLLDKICFVYNRPKIKDEGKLAFYAAQMRKWDDRAHNSVLEHFKRQDSFPQNLSKALDEAYDNWVKANPQSRPSLNCQYCKGRGWVQFLRYAELYHMPQPYMARCSNCGFWDFAGGMVPLARQDEMPFCQPDDYHFTEADKQQCIDIYRLNRQYVKGNGSHAGEI